MWNLPLSATCSRWVLTWTCRHKLVERQPAGGADNITVLLLEVRETRAVGSGAGAAASR